MESKMALEICWRLLYHVMQKEGLVKIVGMVPKIPRNFIIVPGKDFFLERFRV